MAKLQIVAFGKLKTPGLRESADYYLKVLSGFVPCEEIELKPLSVSEKSPELRRKIQTQEAEVLLQRVTPQSSHAAKPWLYLLDEKGKALPSSGWAELARSWEDQSAGRVVLCLGSSLGFAPELRAQARGLLSLGPHTLPHELARVVLLEQLFRSWSILRGHPYHNAD